jgi:hypothetical protein
VLFNRQVAPGVPFTSFSWRDSQFLQLEHFIPSRSLQQQCGESPILQRAGASTLQEELRENKAKEISPVLFASYHSHGIYIVLTLSWQLG